MFPCSSCHRHIREVDPTCPFCGTTQRLESSPTSTQLSRVGIGAFALVAAATLGSVGCASRTGPDDGGMTTTSNGTGTGTAGETASSSETAESGSETSTTGDGDGDATTVTSQTTLSFYAGPDHDLPVAFECDTLAQDCAEGDKCVPYSPDGVALSATRCVPVTGDRMQGEECVYGGIVEPSDDCDENTQCFHVRELDGELRGVCTPFCEGSVDAPSCAAGTTCLVSNDRSIAACVATCDPVAQDCPDAQMCAWHEDAFVCVLEPVDAMMNDEPCELGSLSSSTSCEAGQHCVAGDALETCGPACCTEYCDTSDLGFRCANDAHTCVPFFDVGGAPRGLDDVGICIRP